METSDLNKQTKTPELDVVRIVFLRGEDEVLLVKEVDDINWKLPGGKIQAGETIFEAVVREIEEELGVEITKEEILNFDSANIPDSENIRYIFLVAELEEGRIQRTEEVEEAAYFKLSELPETKFRGHISSAVEIIRV